MHDDAAQPGRKSPDLRAVSFAELPGWEREDHLEAASAFAASLDVLAKAGPAFADVVQAFAASRPFDGASAKAFFETHFAPHRVEPADTGLLTGYFEPEFHGALESSASFAAPLLARPGDLVNLLDDAARGARPTELTHARLRDDGSTEPYFTRAEIYAGALDTAGLELCFLPDAVDVFIMQVQGSGLVRLPDGRGLRLNYDGKNGYPYTSLGRLLIDEGVFTPGGMNLEALGDWLKADLERARRYLERNESYVFFRILGPEEETSPLGTDSIPLTPFRSLAVDTGHYPLGLPILVTAPTANHIQGEAGGFHRLMIAHDVGSAINGRQRGDVFCGTGACAGRRAGITKHEVRFYPLLPKATLDPERELQQP